MTNQRDLELFRLAALRQGAISVTELRSIGLDSAAVRRRVQGGVLKPFYRGVYVVPSLEGPDKQLHAATLAMPNGALARSTAAARLGLPMSERRGKRVRGMRDFAILLAALLDDEPFPESMFEVELMKGFVEVGLTGMSRQYRPSWYDGIRGTVDFHDSFGSDSIVEADGRGFRQVTQAHNNDRQRDRLAVSHGAVVIRIGHREFKQRRMGILLEVKEIIERRHRQDGLTRDMWLPEGSVIVNPAAAGFGNRRFGRPGLPLRYVSGCRDQ